MACGSKTPISFTIFEGDFLWKTQVEPPLIHGPPAVLYRSIFSPGVRFRTDAKVFLLSIHTVATSRETLPLPHCGRGFKSNSAKMTEDCSNVRIFIVDDLPAVARFCASRSRAAGTHARQFRRMLCVAELWAERGPVISNRLPPGRPCSRPLPTHFRPTSAARTRARHARTSARLPTTSTVPDWRTWSSSRCGSTTSPPAASRFRRLNGRTRPSWHSC
jgi:hypothetical protein